ncbi:MAG: DUF3316 domain-containing protein [Candidatus Symbiothrix sp.]|nr:DUF3316 domain-containing protein [Candidatus Symbiothrix sp.]
MKIIFLSLLSLFSLFSFAQDKISLTYQSTMIGIGNTRAYDTYLSPLEYSGANFGIIHEQLKMTGLMNGNVSAQHLFNIELAEAENPMGNATGYVGSLEYGYGLHYRFQPVRKIQVFAGLQADGLVGFIYNTRNGNNPVNAKVNLNFNLSGMATYRFRIKKQPVQLRYQLNIPVAGCLFSPEFGQSYYEIGEGDSGHLVHFASLHNQWIMRNFLSVELPLPFCTLRLGYMNWIYETKVNSLDTRILSNSIYIGVSKNFFNVPARKINKNNYQSVFE